MPINNNKNKQISIIGCGIFILSGLFQSSYADDLIEKAKWDSDRGRITISGTGDRSHTVKVYSAADSSLIGDDGVGRRGDWRVRESKLSSVPCRVKAEQSDGSIDERAVANAPADCDAVVVVQPPVNPTLETPVEPSISPLSGDFTILAANDLGMHCADQDFRIFSILPPYNVLNAQVLKKGSEPQMMSPADGVHVTYKAANSNYFSDFNNPKALPDPLASITRTSLNSQINFKNNFWETVTGASVSPTGIDKIGFIAYAPLYPPNVLNLFPSTPDLGLPAPDIEKLWLLGMGLHAEQSAMPGLNNKPQKFHGYIENYPFFTKFSDKGFPTLGYIVNNFKRYTAEGVPISSIDDRGRVNPYPLMTIEARDTNNNVLASVDTVVPVASEADCQQCHVSQPVCELDTSTTLTCNDLPGFNYDVAFIETKEQAELVIGANAQQKVINSAKLNIPVINESA
ncbi:MAG: hypothetical protein KZQ70_08900 [gamma proteobacterium symbiont of Lucinoma myriamae]|nr:hypothetical protein [gamma proteobacterium symbiont of Lucinoma myriamae]MCU7818445.1 hypothetical protein [gamma proteobacterium symbiont of Lucinoma myriamae]MCU7832631.1 hypothetical protein [gamma proteobacterium symbiont of Lucinoma myriamae]